MTRNKSAGAPRKKRLYLFRAFFLAAWLLLFPAFAQTAPAENAWGIDYEGKAITAVLPLAGEEREMARQFHQEIMRAVTALGKYSPREAAAFSGSAGEREIPTDMPPNRDLVPDVRYALTGGVYAGSRPDEFYLQLWLWDMSGSTMIYTDDLIYADINAAMSSVPGLVEWLFSHIREITIETPKIELPMDPLFTLGLRAGLSPRWYADPDEVAPGAWAFALEGGVSVSLRLGSHFALQGEVFLEGDTVVYREELMAGENGRYTMINEKFSSLSLSFPLLLKANFRPGVFKIAPLAGLYLTAPLGDTVYRKSSEDNDLSYSWSFSVPLGFILGIEASVEYGPGFLAAGIRYAGDFGSITIDNDEETSYRRNMISFYLSYEFGFVDLNKINSNE
jgi:hypothetical protein